ncbi:MAG: hypothetical protein QW257_01870, partial [Candidatus Micrarchaeaceae archaeon]
SAATIVLITYDSISAVKKKPDLKTYRKTRPIAYDVIDATNRGARFSLSRTKKSVLYIFTYAKSNASSITEANTTEISRATALL